MHLFSLINLIILIVSTSHLCLSQEIIPENVSLTIYPDGYVFVDYYIITNQTNPSQNITVLGQILEDLIILNGDGLPLGYVINGSLLEVYSLGTEEISLTYLTQDITSKNGRFWTLTVFSPTRTRIVLPSEAAIISLNKVPEIIETVHDKVTLLMSAGQIEVTYVIGVIGNREYTQIVIDETEGLILEIKNSGVIILDAETKLEQSKNAFTLGNFAEAETFANEAKNLAIQKNQTAKQASIKIVESQLAITNAENEGRFFGLDNSKHLLDQANILYEEGNYTTALTFAINSIAEAQNSTVPQVEKSYSFPIFEFFIIALIFSVPILLFSFIRSRKKAVSSIKKKRIINNERIFKENKNLIFEEKQAIQFLIDNGGEAFEAELYDYVKLPRTTTWRMVKRLKNMGIITVTKFRRQNLVRLKTKYDIKD